MMLTTNVKESIKTALAMTIAFGIALSMNWDHAYWAGFAVAFVSLGQLGLSLNKAALRMSGTLIAMVISWALMAVFSQDRWAFMLGLSLVTGICCYMMGGKKYQYFWNITGLVTVIICFDTGLDVTNGFHMAVLRAEETGLGILVYSLVAIFIWPTRSRSGFDSAVASLASNQHQLVQAYFDLASGRGDEPAAAQLKAGASQAKASFDQSLSSAETDNAEVFELRGAWRNYQFQVAELMDVLERWRASIDAAKGLDLPHLISGMALFETEIDTRLTQIEQVLVGQPPERSPQKVELSVNRSAVDGLGYFQRSAIVVVRDQMLQLEKVTRSLFEALGEVQGFEATDTSDTDDEPVRNKEPFFVPDLDRLGNTVRHLTILWLVFFLLVYGGDIPGGSGFLTMVAAFGFAVVNMPQVNISKLINPSVVSIAFAGVLYIFVMPQLSSYFELGLLIFAVTFAICYWFAAPQQMLGRAFGLSMFVVIAGVTNSQSYSFISVATTAVMMAQTLFVFALTAYIPWSPRPERVFVRLLGRFFQSSDYLLSTMLWEPGRPVTRIERWKMAFHAREIATLPAKLNTWLPYLDDWVLSSNTKVQVQALISSLQGLDYHIGQLLTQRDIAQEHRLMHQLADEFSSWRAGIQESLQKLPCELVIEDNVALHSGMDRKLAKLEARINEVVDTASGGQHSDQDVENFYRLLGSYRGVSEALLNYTDNAVAIDWAPWHQERFA